MLDYEDEPGCVAGVNAIMAQDLRHRASLVIRRAGNVIGNIKASMQFTQSLIYGSTLSNECPYRIVLCICMSPCTQLTRYKMLCATAVRHTNSIASTTHNIRICTCISTMYPVSDILQFNTLRMNPCVKSNLFWQRQLSWVTWHQVPHIAHPLHNMSVILYPLCVHPLCE